MNYLDNVVFLRLKLAFSWFKQFKSLRRTQKRIILMTAITTYPMAGTIPVSIKNERIIVTGISGQSLLTIDKNK